MEGHTIRLVITSYAKDFSTERDVLLKEVIPDLKVWCEANQLQLQESEVQWGRSDSSSLQALLQEISQCYFNNVMPFFINLTSESLGLVPMWGEAPERMIDDYQKRLHLSAAQMELLFAAYREDNQNGVFVIRDDNFLEDLEDDEKRHFVTVNVIPKAIHAVTKKLLNRYPEERVLHYDYDCAGYDHCEQRLRVEMGEKFAQRVKQFVISRLRQNYLPNEASGDVHTQMRDAQESFMKGRSHRLRGRADVIDKIEEYIATGGQEVPLLLLGGAGSGKSSVMARVADLCVSKAAAGQMPNADAADWKVFYHFVGAAPRSTELGVFLKRLCRDLDIIHESSIPKDLNATAQLSCNALSNANTQPTIIFVDALNQFDEDQAAVLVSWLPRKLGSKVRCVVSLINDTPQHKLLMSRDSKPQELHMTPLDFESRKQIVQETLGQYQRPLTQDQLNRLLTKQTSENPLWLSMACEELRVIQDTKDMDARIDELPNGLLNLLEQVLSRFECEQGPLVVATLCLLEASATGLLEDELLAMLGDEQTLNPPSPFDEKEEKECSEKSDKSRKKKTSLTRDKWMQVFRVLRPFLRPYGDSREGRLDFYHRAMSKAVRQKFFRQGEENTDEEEAMEMNVFWHRRLAAYFETCTNVDRKVEEYLYHLCKIGDVGRLVHCLTDWNMFDKMFNEEFSVQLLGYWRQVGNAGEMITEYKALLSQLEEQHPHDDELLATRHQHIARIFLQAGKYSESLELTRVALKVEEQDLGCRQERMVELYSLMSEIYDEKLKLNDFVSRSQIPDLRKTIRYGRRSIALRKEMSGDYHKLKLGLSLMKLAFSLESWEACGGDLHLSGPDALAEGNCHIDTALEIFKDLKDDGHYAEALMTKGVLAPRGSPEQLKYYNESMDICMQVYGEKSLLTSRLYINIGIVWEDNKNYVKAYDYFRKWCAVSEHVLGPTHPKTLRAKGVLKEPRYRLVALRISEQDFLQGENNAPSENSINQEVEELDEINDDYNILNQAPNAWPDEADEDFGGSGGSGSALNAEGLVDLANVTGDLRDAINEIFLTAIGQDQMADQLLGTLANAVQGLNVGIGPGEEGHQVQENNDHDDHEDSADDDDQELADVNPADNRNIGDISDNNGEGDEENDDDDDDGGDDEDNNIDIEPENPHDNNIVTASMAAEVEDIEVVEVNDPSANASPSPH